MVESISIRSRRQGLLEITGEVRKIVQKAGVREGICTVFVQHTSASLCIQENADPSAKEDLENWFNRLARENDPIYTHTFEGPDDMPSHIKAALTDVSLSIPILNSRLALGTWQGIYLWEHRRSAHTRNIVVHVGE